MSKEDIENTRRLAIKSIKEKIKQNPKYLNPCNNERLKDMKMLKFESGYDFTCWMQQNGILKNPFEVRKEEFRITLNKYDCKNYTEYVNKCAKDLGYKDRKERRNEDDWRKGLRSQISEDIDCPSYFGVYIAENYIMKTFENPIKMPYNNIGYDWICNNVYKIESKASCLNYLNGKTPRWKFNILFNNIADYFILSAWDSRDSLKPMHIWIFYKNDIVRGNKFWMRDAFSITNGSKYLKEFEKFEVFNKLEKLKFLLSEPR